jgi:hypothetical protein
MIDRIYAIALILIFVLLQYEAATIVGLGLLLLAFLAAIPLFLFEGLANLLGPRLQRDLLTFRYKPKRAIPRLIRHLALDTPQSPMALKDKAGQLAKAAHAVTTRHPNPLYGPVRLERLCKALEAQLSPANKAFTAELRKAWIGASPGPSLGGLITRARAAIGSFLFGKWIAIARSKSISGAASIIAAPPAHRPGEAWKTPDYPGVVTFLAWRRLAEASDLPVFTSNPAWLPLSAQRKLAAITAQLYGTGTQALLARLLNPSTFSALRKIANDRVRWLAWSKEHETAQAARRAEKATRDSYREKGSLTQDEITSLIPARAQDSILLNRVWPPGAPATGNSWLGGLPCLPPDMDWPRNSATGLPLHFLAQVDCADLPTLNGTSPLPRDGLLLFFSDLDEERLSESDAVVHVPKARQSVPPRALPDDLPEIDHGGGKPLIFSDEPGKRHYPKWPVVPTAVKIWGDAEEAEPKTFNYDYLDQSRAAHDASLAAVMPPPANSVRTGDLYPYRQRKDAEGKTILTAEGKAIPYHVFDPKALPDSFPFCGAGIEAFIRRLQLQAEKAAREAASTRSFIDAKWNDTEEKRASRRSKAEAEEDTARRIAGLAQAARDVLGTLPALQPVAAETISRLHAWLSTLADQARDIGHVVASAVSDAALDLARASVTDPALAQALPQSVYDMHATSLVPSPRQSQHLMLGPAQHKTNSTAGSGVRLLCLDSDDGLGMMYCDCGVLEYWISPEHLAAGRFDKAYANTAGG